MQPENAIPDCEWIVPFFQPVGEDQSCLPVLRVKIKHLLEVVFSSHADRSHLRFAMEDTAAAQALFSDRHQLQRNFLPLLSKTPDAIR